MTEQAIMVLHVGDFGAVGDGVTDDSLAIGKAIDKAQAYTRENPEASAVVEFEENAVYRVFELTGEPCFDEGCLVGSPPKDLCLHLIRVRNVTLRGHNTTLLGDPSKLYLYVASCDNVRVEGFRFTYDAPIAVTATVVRREDNTVDFEVPERFNFPGNYFDFKYLVFALPANGRRDHSFFQTMTRVSDTVYRITFSHGGYPLMNPGTKAYIPVPGYGFGMVGFAIIGCDRFTLADCVIDEVGSFVFSINGNRGTLTMSHVDVVPKDPGACPISSWRDCIHAKDNRGPLVLDSCTFWGHEDDVLNISNTCLEAVQIPAPDFMQVKGINYGPSGVFHRIHEGDTVTVVNHVTGKLFGTTRVRDVLCQDGGNIWIRLEDGYEGMTPGEMWLSIVEFCNPGTVIRGCDLSGTIRIRGEATVTDTRFEVLQAWTALEADCFEGPIPKNIHYRGCHFERARKEVTGPIMTFNCGCRQNIPTEYTVRDITFEHCVFDDDNMMELPADGGVTVCD